MSFLPVSSKYVLFKQNRELCPVGPLCLLHFLCRLFPGPCLLWPCWWPLSGWIWQENHWRTGKILAWLGSRRRGVDRHWKDTFRQRGHEETKWGWGRKTSTYLTAKTGWISSYWKSKGKAQETEGKGGSGLQFMRDPWLSYYKFTSWASNNNSRLISRISSKKI